MKGNVIYEEKGRRYFVYLAVSFLLGIFYSLRNHIGENQLCDLLKFSAIFLVCTLFLFAVIMFLCRKLRDVNADIVLAYFMLIFFLLGIYRTSFYENIQYRSLKSSAGEKRLYTGIVRGNPELSGSGKTYGFPVKVLYYEEEETKTEVDGSIMLYAPINEGDVMRGDAISFEVNLSHPEGAPYKGGFSMRSYIYRQNLCFSAYAKEIKKTTAEYTPDLKDRLCDMGYIIQEYISSSIDKNFGGATKESALLKGIILGVREDFAPEQYESFSKSGLIHITAVSGMHIMFLFSTLLYMLRKLRAPKWIAYLIIAPCLVIFAAATMFTPSVCRAVIMMSVFMLAFITQGESDGITSIFIAATVIVAVNPYALTGYSFILSFSTTLGIILFAGPLNGYISQVTRINKLRKNKKLSLRLLGGVIGGLIASLCVSISGYIGMVYFVIRFFRRLSWGSIFANIILIYFAGTCFVVGILSCAISDVMPDVAGFVTLYMLKPMLWTINSVADFFSKSVFIIKIKTPPESLIILHCILAWMLHYFLVTKPIQIRKAGLHR